jgi:NADH-quinone oxidoreductase subunit K
MNEPYFWITVANLVFAVGLYGLLTRRNAVGMLMSVELLLNAGAMLFVAANRFIAPGRVDGQVMALFIIVVAAAEVVVAMALLVAIYQQRKTVDAEAIDLMRN